MARRDKTFRVFVSSTFSDLIAERNALQEKAFPELRKYCQERGARFLAIDLRWGVNQEAALDQQTMNICMEELRRCQRLSPRPNFIVLLGNRYGWRPLPAQVAAEEFEELLSQVPDKKDKVLLHTDSPVQGWRDDQRNERIGWYRKDLNAVPATYLLKPRTIDFPDQASDIERKRIRQEEAQDWAELEFRMLSLLITAIGKLNWPTSDSRRFKYEASATHQEIRAGALDAEDPKEHVFCYFRDIDGLPSDGRGAGIREIKNSAVDTVAEGRLKHLKDEELGELLPNNHIHKYLAQWKDGAVEADLDSLCERVQNDLKGVIDRELSAFTEKPSLEREREAHREFAEERCRHFIGREEILRRIKAYAVSDDTHPLVIHGKSGSGKTALMAQAVHELGRSLRPSESLIISRFIGATPGSSDLRSLLTDLCRELEVAEIPSDMNDLVKAFRDHLSAKDHFDETPEDNDQLGDQKRVVLFLDALDQLNPTDNARMLYWLPRKMRSGVKLVLSVLDNGKEDGEQTRGDDPCGLSRRIWPKSMVEVGTLAEPEGAEVLDRWLTEAGRTLQDDQLNYVLSKFASCPWPLYLKITFEEAKCWKSWDWGSAKLSSTVEGILEQLLMRLERPENHGNILVNRSLGYLSTGKNGLTEDELLDVLSMDKEVVKNFSERSPDSPKLKDKDPLPVIIWSRLFADISPYMVQRRADGTVVMDFYHRQVGEAVRKRYLPTKALVEAHLHLADYFNKLDYWAEPLEAQRARAKRLPPTPRPANVRKVVELPYHRLQVAKLAGQDDPVSPYWDAVADLLTDWQFLEAKAEADPNFQEQESKEPSPMRQEVVL